VVKILNEEQIKPHKVRYYLEQRDPEFAKKMADVLCVYRRVKNLKKAAAATSNTASDSMAIVSYDESRGSRRSHDLGQDPEPFVFAEGRAIGTVRAHVILASNPRI